MVGGDGDCRVGEVDGGLVGSVATCAVADVVVCPVVGCVVGPVFGRGVAFGETGVGEGREEGEEGR